MFRRLPEVNASAVMLTVDGVPVSARPGDTVAAAMLAAGVDACRTTPVTGSPRGPYCLMGVCFDCLVTIDGIGNRQACLITAAPGMRVERQVGARDITAEANTTNCDSPRSSEAA
jgi:D-hydroxyproline dehydrogenase subunit gamma